MLKSDSGFALVIVIWVLTLLSLMAGSFALSMRRDNAVTIALKNNASAIALTESSLNVAQFMLNNPVKDQQWLSDGSVYRFSRPDGSEIRIKIVSESGKVDINVGDETELAAVISAVTQGKFAEQELLNRILDWRDEDDDPRQHGAEKKQYIDAGLNYVPSNKPFQSLEELQMVLGVNDSIFNQLKPWITIYSGQSKVNMQEAAPDLQEILNANMQQQTTPNQNATSQNGLSANLGTQNNADGNNIDNQAYTIIVEVKMDEGASASLEAVTKFQNSEESGGSRLVMDWKQNQLSHSLFASDMDNYLITVQDEFTINN